MKNLCLFLLMSLMLVSCSDDPNSPDTFEALPSRNAKTNDLNGKANAANSGTTLAASASVDAAMNSGATQFLGTWKVTHFDVDKKAWNEEEKGGAPWVTFYNDGTMVGDTVSHYFPTGQYVISGGWVVMFAIEGSDVDYYAKLAVDNIEDYEMEAVYVGSPLSPIGDELLRIWMKKQEQ